MTTEMNMKNVDAFIAAAKKVGNQSEAIRADLKGLLTGDTEADGKAIDEYNKTARERIKAKVTDTEAQAKVLALFAKVVSTFRKDNGLGGKRAAGAGRPKADGEAVTDEAVAKDDAGRPSILTVEDVLHAITEVIKAAPAANRKAIRDRIINAAKTA